MSHSQPTEGSSSKEHFKIKSVPRRKHGNSIINKYIFIALLNNYRCTVHSVDYLITPTHAHVDGWIILGWISRRWDVGIWTGLGWARIETGGGRL